MAKIGLAVSVASFLGLALVIALLGDGKGSDYVETIGAIGDVKLNLTPAMLAFGLALVTFAGITTWMLSLYASFRIAGPLYRISRDLETQIEKGAVRPIPIRTTDRLQTEWKEFEASVTALRTQQQELWQAVNEISQILDTKDAAVDNNLLAAAVSRLGKVDQNAQL